jgi:N-acetylneuraminic acid mutarotase
MRHTAVWTGREMIVWGGSDDFGTFFDDGARYDPSTDSWLPMSQVGAPSGRVGHTAVWTGTEMIIWGGGAFDPDTGDPVWFNDGYRYNPSSDMWTRTSQPAPAARTGHTVVWTGTQMIVWGGANPFLLSSGGVYDPSTDTWTSTSQLGVPSARDGHTAVWTGTEMIIWGGIDASFSELRTGGRYDPLTNTWVATTLDGAPSARDFHTAVWTSSQMIIWGGYAGFPTGSGSLYTP